MNLEKNLEKEYFEDFEFFELQEDYEQFAINYFFEENLEIKKLYNEYLELPGKEEFKEQAEKAYYQFTEEFLPEYLSQLRQENNFEEVIPGVPF